MEVRKEQLSLRDICCVQQQTPVYPEQSRLRLRLIRQKSKLRLLSSVRAEE